MLIGILGNAGVGKSTMARIIQEELDCEVVSFAQKLREELRETFSKSKVDFWSSAKGQSVWLVQQQIDTKLEALLHPYLDFGGWSIPLRKLLQLYGTEYRRKQNPFYWIEALFLSLDPTKSYIIDDVRFENEAEMIKTLGGYVIHLDLEGNLADTHSSESNIINIHSNIKYTQPNKTDLKRLKADTIFILNCLQGLHNDITRETISPVPSKGRIPR